MSILLVLFNQAALTLGCLRAIAATVRLPAEVIIVDNASSDETAELLSRLDGARVIRNPENRHFLHAVNQAAAAARGAALLLLNNDACLRPGTLQAAWERLNSAEDIGAVGGPDRAAGRHACRRPAASSGAMAAASATGAGAIPPSRSSSSSAMSTIARRSGRAWRTLMRRTKRHADDFVGINGRRYQFRVQAVTASGARSPWAAVSVALRGGRR